MMKIFNKFYVLQLQILYSMLLFKTVLGVTFYELRLSESYRLFADYLKTILVAQTI